MSEDNVHHLHEQDGQQTFVMCPCEDDGILTTPVVLHDPKGPIIVALMCPECEREIPVVDGLLQGKHRN